jgi:hypothetical protein
MFPRTRRVLFLVALVLGAFGLLLGGEFGLAAIAFLALALMFGAAAQPFAMLSRGPSPDQGPDRGWVLGGILWWDWGVADYLMAGLIGTYAIGQAASLPAE